MTTALQRLLTTSIRILKCSRAVQTHSSCHLIGIVPSFAGKGTEGMLEDGETQFLNPCKNHVNACTYAATRWSTVHSHERKCTVAGPELALAFKQVQKPIQCKDPGCSK